eukprot:5983639-Amphidinium_carterae.1
MKSTGTIGNAQTKPFKAKLKKHLCWFACHGERLLICFACRRRGKSHEVVFKKWKIDTCTAELVPDQRP